MLRCSIPLPAIIERHQLISGQDIKEHCYILNRYHGNSTYVGNVCINRFIQISTGNLFDDLKRITQDDTANARTVSVRSTAASSQIIVRRRTKR